MKIRLIMLLYLNTSVWTDGNIHVPNPKMYNHPGLLTIGVTHLMVLYIWSWIAASRNVIVYWMSSFTVLLPASPIEVEANSEREVKSEYLFEKAYHFSPGRNVLNEMDIIILIFICIWNWFNVLFLFYFKQNRLVNTNSGG